MYMQGQHSIPSDTVCYPAKLMHGHIENLLEKGVDAIFYPCMTYNLDEERATNHYNCPVVAYYPELLKANVSALADFDFMMPYFELADKKRFTKHAVKYFCGKYPQIKKKQVIAAVEEAYLAQDEYYIDVRIEGQRAIRYADEHDLDVAVIAGRPYEVVPGSTDKAIDICMDAVIKRFTGERMVRYGEVKHLFRFVLTVFGKLKLDKTQKKKLVGIVGEIYVKFSPLGNNRLEEFLLSEGCEPVLPGLMDFCLYCIYNSVIDHELYSRNGKTAAVYKMVYQFVLGKQADIIKMMKKDGHFRPPMPFDEVRKKSHAIIGQGVKMGEGWLLPAEMVELISEGVTNIVCTQPFGCLPNHIAGKGMIRKIREVYPQANIVAVDYDPGASKINQENRIKLMLSSAE